MTQRLTFASLFLLTALSAACSGGNNWTPVDGGTGPDGGPGTSPDGGGPGPTSGWNPRSRVGAERNGSAVRVSTLDVDLSESGEALVAWADLGRDTEQGSVWVSVYQGGAWKPEVRLTEPSMYAINPRVALNAAGDAVIAWEVVGLGTSAGIESRTVWARRRVAGVWTPAVRLCAAPSAPYKLWASLPRVGIDAAGHALVGWHQQGDDGQGIFASRFDGASWTPPLQLDGGERLAQWPDVAVSTGGHAAVVWVQHTNPNDPQQSGGGPTIPNIWARILTGGTWGAPERIGTPDLADYEGAERPVVVMDASGRAFALWEEHRSTQNRVVAARFDPSGPAWSAPVQVATSTSPTDYLSFLSVATDGLGGAFAVWEDSSADNGAASRFDPAQGSWSAPSEFESGGALMEARA
ncbi:MAG: hypothetical protein L0Y66_17795, partial [Myxococcaceae bacterium]|nr:hypothetical protein [Myxococcaceae bacterium]